jgi:hypothetical protein
MQLLENLKVFYAIVNFKVVLKKAP